VTAARWRWIWLALIALGIILGLRTLFGFPWRDTVDALEGASLSLLGIATAINFLSPFFKGAGWHQLLRGVAPVPWWVAQEANFIGTAVNSLSIGATGEAARIAVVTERGGVSSRAALLSVAASKATEGIALACFLVVAPLALDLPIELRTVQVAAAALLVLTILFVAFGHRDGWITRAPRAARRVLEELQDIGGGPRLVLPIACALASWTVEWMVFHAVLWATLGRIPYAMSFTALIVTNLSGVLRLTPGNVGIMQAATVAALLPFDVGPEAAIAAGLALQAVQILPILAFTLILVQRRGLGWALSAKTPGTQESS
jgi:uncharacterized membrane protein YbhN (UPF0104 family)